MTNENNRQYTAAEQAGIARSAAWQAWRDANKPAIDRMNRERVNTGLSNQRVMEQMTSTGAAAKNKREENKKKWWSWKN
jgi:hypothetical protein